MAQVHKIKLVKKGFFLEKEFKNFPYNNRAIKKFQVRKINIEKYQLILPTEDEFELTESIDTIIDLSRVKF